MSAPLGIGLPAIGSDQMVKGRSGGQKGQDDGDVFSQAIDRLSAKDAKGQRGGTGNGQAGGEASSSVKGEIEVDITNAPRGGRDGIGTRDAGNQDRSALLALFDKAVKQETRATDASVSDAAGQNSTETPFTENDMEADAASELTRDSMNLASPLISHVSGSGADGVTPQSFQPATAKTDTISIWLQSRGAMSNLPITAGEMQAADGEAAGGTLPGANTSPSVEGETAIFRGIGARADVPTLVVDAVARSIAQGMVKGDATKADPIRLDGAPRGGAEGVDPESPQAGVDADMADAPRRTGPADPAERLMEPGGRQERADTLLRAGVDLSILESRKFLGVAAGQTSTAGIVSTVTENAEWNAMLRDVASTSATTLDTARNASNTLKIQLSPVELGMVTATFRMSGGHLTIELKVETIEAYRQLSDDQSGLAKALKAQGIEAENVIVQHVGSDRSTQTGSASVTGGGSAAQHGNAEGGGSQQSATGQQRGEAGGEGRRNAGREQGEADARRNDRTSSGDVYL